MNEQQPTPEVRDEHWPAGQAAAVPTAEPHEALPRDGPRIYVASLADYNNGILHGQWIDADDDTEVMHEQIEEMLKTSPTNRRYGELAEEWAIHDYEGFGDLRLGELDSLDYIARLADGMGRYGLAFTAWAAEVNSDREQMAQFEERFQGEWDSAEGYAENMLDELGAQRVIGEAPEWLQPFLKLDVESFARDLELGGDIITAETPEGRVWVWSGW